MALHTQFPFSRCNEIHADFTSSILQGPPFTCTAAMTPDLRAPTPPRKARPPLLAVHSSLLFRSYRSIEQDTPSDFDWAAYVSYYVPIALWLPKYRAAYVVGDLLAGVLLASFQIPLVMSMASSLAKVPPLVGLYSAIAAAVVYAVFGGVPTLIVGPLPALLVLYGQVIGDIVKSLEVSVLEASAALSLGMSLTFLVGGVLRWGFLDKIFSRALLKGFVGAMGVIIITNQLAIQMRLPDTQPTVYGKIHHAVTHMHEAHGPTVGLTLATLALVLAVRRVKSHLLKRHPAAVYIPELLAMIVAATVLLYVFDWQSLGIEVVGELGAERLHGVFVGVSLSNWALYRNVFQTSLLCAVLGYFDSLLAIKALSAKYNYDVLLNRELVALGFVNAAIAAVGGLPSFGALGRSKVNVLAGARTPMLLLFMAATIAVSVFCLLPCLFWLPECVLALSTTIIGLTVLEEAPLELGFLVRIHGYDEIALFFAVFFTTCLWSVQAGVLLGVVVAVGRALRHGTASRIQVLERVPNTAVFRNADELLEETLAVAPTAPQRSDVLIVRIPEPLTFANIGDLRTRLTRLEKFASLAVHPLQPPLTGFHDGAIKLVLFDCKGMTGIDALATQALYEAVQRYIEKDISVAFSRVPLIRKVRERLVLLGLAAAVNGVKARGDVATATGLGAGFFLSIDEALLVLGPAGERGSGAAGHREPEP